MQSSQEPTAALRQERVAYFAMLSDGRHPLELRCKADTNWVKRWARTPEEADVLAARETVRGRDVYVGLAPRRGSTGIEQRLYEPCQVLWADCDSARAVQALALFEPAPTAVVLSGGQDHGVAKRHAYWRLTEPLSADMGPEAVVRRHALRLAQHLSADMGACDAARVLRVPGSRHHGNGNVARLVSFTGETHDLESLTGDLSDAPQWKALNERVAAKTADELTRMFTANYTHETTGRHDPFRSIVGVLLRRCGWLPPDVLLELACCWAQVHTTPCKDRRELERNFDNLLERERRRRGRAVA
jgi:hypothetical protein